MTSPFKALENLMVKDLPGGVPLESTIFRFVNIGSQLSSPEQKRKKGMQN
jgi:hypothetical protein